MHITGMSIRKWGDALSDFEGRALAGMIADLQRESGVRMIIVLAETTAPEQIEQYHTDLWPRVKIEPKRIRHPL